MEKKVYLKDLVEFGSNTRKQITSKVRVSDQGVYPIGEIWDANTVVDVIVNGAHEQHDTLRELDQLAHSTQNQLNAEIARAKAAEQELEDKKADREEMNTLVGDLGYKLVGHEPEYWTVDGIRYDYDPSSEYSNSFDYIYDETSWNESYQNGGLKLYYEAYPAEDLWNTVENRPANINDRAADGTYPNCIHSWQGAINAPGARYPWIVPHFDTDINAKIVFEYEGKESVYPWGDRIFGNGNGHRVWGCASVPSELGDEFLLTNGVTTFDISKFKMKLVRENVEYHEEVPGELVPYDVKTYINDAIQAFVKDYVSSQIPVGAVGSEQIADGSIRLEDLSNEVTDKMQVTVDEDDENANFPGL